ncbi:MAG: nitrilase-related carbon-nitrogen hydrolase, partial [Candidatus Omnitrophota bacterium]
MKTKRKTILRVALAQINTTVGDLPGNVEKILGFVERAQAQEADLVVFPEMTVCGYPPEDLLHKEHFVRDNLKALRKLAGKISQTAAVIGFVDSDKKKHLFSAAAVIHAKRIQGVYHKRDLPNYGVFDEKRYFSEGKKDVLFSFGGVPCSINICEDIWVEKGIYREQVRAGSRVLINISSSPYHVGKFEQRERLLVERAVQNNVFVCYVNLVGGQDELVFDGASLIVDPRGKILASAKQFEEDLIVADLDILPQKIRGMAGRKIKTIMTS